MTPTQCENSVSAVPINQAPPRHVVYIIDQLDSLKGGAERSLLNTIRLLPQHRYRASVVTFKRPEDPSCLLQFPCPAHVFPLERTYGWEALRVALKLRRLIRNERVAIVQTFFESSDLWAGPITKLSGCPVLISSRRDMGFRRRPMHQVAYRLFRPFFDRVHTVSDAVRDYTIRQDGIDPAKVVTIMNGIDVDSASHQYDTQRLRSSYGLENASHLIVDVTSIRRVKGIDILARTAAVVCRDYPAAVFVVVGSVAEQGYFKELNELRNRLGLTENFRFIGGKDEVFPFLQMSDVFCHLSRSDGLSNAMLEAMACGLPCVVSRAGGNPQVVSEGRNGFVVPVDHPELAADRIVTLLRYPESRRRMGEDGRQRVSEAFSAATMVHHLVDLYDQLLEPAD